MLRHQTRVSGSGLRLSTLSDHLEDSFDSGLLRMNRALGMRPLYIIAFETFICFFLGLLLVGSAPFYFLRGRAEVLFRGYYGAYFLMVALGCCTWFLMPFKTVDRRIQNHRFRTAMMPSRVWIGRGV